MIETDEQQFEEHRWHHARKRDDRGARDCRSEDREREDMK